MCVTAPQLDTDLDTLLRTIDDSCIAVLFQPIVDLRHGVAAAYEVFARGPVPYDSPDLLFARAAEIGATAALERACRAAALEGIAALPARLRSSHPFFLNVSAEVLDDVSAPANVVFEVSERASLRDAAVRHFAKHGVQVGLDHVGCGESTLSTLVSCSYLKLDMDVTRGVERAPGQRAVVRTMASMARNVGAVLIAAGVETWAEAETLIQCGVEWAQGFLFARPAPQPAPLDSQMSRMIWSTWRALH